MRLAMPPEQYRRGYEIERNRMIERADAANLKRNSEIEVSAGKIILTSPGGLRFVLTVSDAGVLGTTAL